MKFAALCLALLCACGPAAANASEIGETSPEDVTVTPADQILLVVDDSEADEGGLHALARDYGLVVLDSRSG